MSFRKYNNGILNYVLDHYECDCLSSEHMVKVTYMLDETGTKLDEDTGLYLEIHLITYKSFFQRLVASIRYLFGHKSRYGDFDSFLFKDQDVDNLLEVLQSYKKLKEKV